MSFRSIALLSINIFTLSLLLLASPFSHAQNYPVQVNVNVATPCPVRLSSLFPGASSRVNLMVLLTDISQPELQVRLRITLEGPGLTLTTRPEFLPIPFTLYGGMPVSLQTELAPYFTTTSLMASGSAASSFTQSGMLPEGMYKLTVQAIEHRRNVVVSNAAMAMAWAIYNDPPEPIQPMNNQVVDAGSLQNVLFTWAPRHILTPGAGGQIGYTLSLWEVPQGVNPELAVQTLPAIGTIESYSPTAIWGPDRPMLIPGKQYAYRIQAADPTGEVAFKNSGNSVVRAFTFGTPCSKPVNLSHSEVTIQSARTAWVPLGGVANFAVEYRPALEEPVNWRSYEVQGSTTTLSSLAPATEYKYRVKSVCGSYHSDPTAEKSFTTLPLPNLDNICTGDAVAPPVANAPLLDNLQSLQVISAGGFLVTIDEVIRTAPYTFSGKGRIAMPLFNTNVKGTFKNIQVNSLLQLTSGKVESVKSETLTVIGGNGSNPNGPGSVDFDNISDTVHITGPIADYHMNPDSTWTVVTTNGDTIVVTPPTDGTGVLVVDPDGNGIVIVGTTAVPYSRDANNNNGTTTPITPTTLCDEQVEFTPSGSMHRYGYDPYRANAASLYQKLQVGTQTLNLAYKSVPQGAADAVYVKPQGNGSLNGITYAYQSGAALTATPAGNGTKSLYLPAPAGGSDNLLALCSMDTTSREAAVAGALSVVSYPLTRHRVAVVPVGSAQPSFSVTELRTQLNAIYAPAVVEWEVTQLPAVTAGYWDENNDTKLQIPATDYSPEMRGVWQAFLANNNATPGTAYLFIVSAFDSAQYKGYMPVQSNYGFLTPSPTPRDAAHELGHGLFNLRHTFSRENAVTLPEGSTQNLMDYSNGTELWKYQWDFTHNPEGGWFVFEDSEEGAAQLKGTYTVWVGDSIVKNKKTLLYSGLTKEIYFKYLPVANDTNKLVHAKVFYREKGTKDEISLPITPNYWFNIESNKKVSIKIDPLPEGNYRICLRNNPTGNAASDTINFYLKKSVCEGHEVNGVIWLGQTSSELKGKRCHWCTTLDGKCCNGGTPCDTCSYDKSKFCCYKTSADSTLKTVCDSSKNGKICDTELCKSNTCCFQTCMLILEKKNITSRTDSIINVATLANPINWKKQSDLVADRLKFDDGVDYIDRNIKSGKPVIVGVHYENRSKKEGNSNPATFHFMVVVKKVCRNGEEYYLFYDPGRGSETVGASSNNLLKVDRVKGMIFGYYREKYYTITEVRRNM